jgi:hypothetical protein
MKLRLKAGLAGYLLVVAGCGGSSQSPANTAGGGGDAGETSSVTGGRPAGSGGTSTGGRMATGGAGSPNGQGGVDLTVPVDPGVFWGPSSEPSEPRTTGARVEPLPRPRCPEEEPSAGEACTVTDEECSYGDSASFACRKGYLCSADGWVESTRPCPEAPANHCPAKIQPGVECTSDARSPSSEPVCEYDAVVCHCPTCAIGSPCSTGKVWTCIAPPVDLDCPDVPPNVGEGCEENTQRCVYGNPCHGGVAVFCRRGAWEREASGCIE